MKNELFLSELLLTVLLLFVHFIVAVALKLCAGNVLCYLEDARYSFISWHNVYSVTVWHSPLQLTVVLSSVYYCMKYILFPWIKCNIGKYRAAFLAFGIACIVCRAGSIHETVLCPFVPSGPRCSRFAAVGVEISTICCTTDSRQQMQPVSHCQLT